MLPQQKQNITINRDILFSAQQLLQ